MVGLFGYLAAGVAQNVGAGMVEQAKALREQRMEELREQRLLAREDRAETRQTARDDKQWQRQTERDEATRSFQRENSGDLVTLEDGSSAVRRGAQVSPLMDEEGKPRSVVQRSEKSPPADVAIAEWLLQNGIAKTPAESWRMTREAKSSDTARAKLVTDVYRSMLGNFADRRPDAEKQKAARDFIDQLIADDANATRGQQQNGTPAAEPIPLNERPDPNELVDGQMYRLRDGTVVRWNKAKGGFEAEALNAGGGQ